MRKKVALHNLGCKVNAYELEKIAASLSGSGYEIVPFTETADVYVVNTCTVTNIADRKSRQMLHRAKKTNPDALVVALGCYVDTDPEGIGKDEAIDIALNNRDKASLARVLSEYFEKKEAASVPVQSVFPAGGLVRSRTRALIKIQDGCNLSCTYCIIPHARGKSRSIGKEEILSEIRTLAGEGVKEVVLTGIHISSYGTDLGMGAGGLSALIREVSGVDGIERIRLGSLEPGTIREPFVEALLSADKLCPHFHLSLQSGSDSVLSRMNRKYRTEDYLKGVDLLRKAYDDPALTTDIITGFPGETEEEAAETLSFVREVAFYELHVFPFSKRKGTPAAAMEGQLTQGEKAERSRLLMALSAELAAAYRSRFIGKKVDVLMQEEAVFGGRKLLTGFTDRYVRVACEADESLRGKILKVVPDGFLEEEILIAKRDSDVV